MIPKLIHQVWLGGPLPDRFAPFIGSWHRLHPEWDYRLWQEEDLPELQNQDLYDRAPELAPGFVGQLRADIVRYELLYLHGGVYVDVDMEALRPIDELLEPGVWQGPEEDRPRTPEVFFGWEVMQAHFRWVNNAIIGATVLHPLMFQLIENLPENVKRRAGRRPNWLSGPKYVTPQLHLFERQGGEGVVIYPQEYFYPYAFNELDRAGETFDRAYAVHHWDNQRKLRRKPL